MELAELKERLKEIEKQGFIKTLKPHQGGAGNTLEQLLGVKENNLSLPDIGEYELKVSRRNSNSMISLITKAPKPRGVNKHLFREYSRTSEKDGIARLYTTVSTKLNPQGFSVALFASKLLLKNLKDIEAYWDIDQLYELLKRKVQNTILVVADTQGRVGSREEYFYYGEAYLLSGLTKDKFVEAIQNNALVVDIRIGADKTGKAKGKYHDHGTGFRIPESKLSNLFANIDTLL